MKVIVTRPLVTVGEELGFLPGGISQKMDPWTVPIFDILGEYFKRDEISAFTREGRLEVVPLAFMRGRTFKNTLIIADEMQNSSKDQFLMLLTRVGEESRLIVTGDPQQSDTPENGLHDFCSRLERFSQSGLIKQITLSMEDVQRSPLVSEVLEIYSQCTTSI